MIRFLADENFNRIFVHALRKAHPAIDLVVAQEAGLTGSTDEVLLEWAAQHGRVLLSHDYTTLAAKAYERVRRGQRMSGVLLMRDDLPVASVVDEIILRAECSSSAEWEGVVSYLDVD